MEALVLLAQLCQEGVYYIFVIIDMLAKALVHMKLQESTRTR